MGQRQGPWLLQFWADGTGTPLVRASFYRAITSKKKRSISPRNKLGWVFIDSPSYQDFMKRGKVLSTKLLSQGYQKTKLVATLKKFYGRHHDLVNPYNVEVSRIVSDVFANDEP